MLMRSYEYVLGELQRGYAEFVHGLEPPLSQLAAVYDIFPSGDASKGKDLFDHLSDRAPMDVLLPSMLSEVFQLAPDDLLAIASSAMFGLFAVTMYDAMFDRQLSIDPDRLLLQNLLYTKALSYLHALFDQHSPFWHYHRTYFGEYFEAIAAERARHSGQISGYGQGEFHRIARGKSAPRKIILAAMAVRADKDASKEMEALSASLDACAIADQIRDDVSDWEKDLKERQFSYLLTRVIASRGLKTRIEVDSCASAAEIAEMTMHMWSSGELQALLAEARELFEMALCHVRELECHKWKQFLKKRAQICLEKKREIEALVSVVLVG